MTSGYLKLKERFRTEHIEYNRTEYLYKTREELKEAEERGEGKINWDKWQELTDTLREELQNIKPKDTRPDHRKYKTIPKTVYTYNSNGDLVKQYASADDAAEDLGITKALVQQYACAERPYHQVKVLFSYRPLYQYQASFQLYQTENGRKVVPKYVYDLRTGKFIGFFKNTEECAKTLGMTTSQVNYQAFMKKPYKKKGYIILNEPMKK